MNYFSQPIERVISELGVDEQQGLSEEEVSRRVEKYGKNKLKENKGKTLFGIFISQFKDFLILILLVAAVISIILGEYIDGIFIILIVIINSILGAVQEQKASNALKALKEMSSPLVKVLREGHFDEIATEELVIGDVVYLEAGDYVPADIRLIDAVNMKIEESALTGESVPTEKVHDITLSDDATIGDRANMAFMSTIVTYGRGHGIVVGTGMGTEIGQIAKMINETEDEGTPLQRKLDSFGKKLGILCLLVCAVIFVLGLIRKQPLLEIFMTSVSLAVAAIPEGLPTVVSVVLALGMQRMVKKNAIVKTLGAVETLGSTTVICSDKTGTLTQNKMVVTKIYDNTSLWKVTGSGYNIQGEITSEDQDSDTTVNLEKILQIGVLCNDAKISKQGIIGDPTEGALVVLGAKGGYPQNDLNKQYPRLQEFPFDSERKLMSTLHQVGEQRLLYTKGAPDMVLSRCDKISVNGEIHQLDESHRQRINEYYNQFAEDALRGLGFAYRVVEEDDSKGLEALESEMIFLGLTGMIDPPREDVKDAIKTCHHAGVRVVMITGDHKATAMAIAKDLGIIYDKDEALSGQELESLTDEVLKSKIEGVNVFARVSPEHKVRIVSALKASGEIAAMTGDGVNDAPALKKADIGIAMGITGTDVSKEAADMILTDDNFTSIVHAVEEGRIIYSNIRKFIGFLLSCNIGELLFIFIAMLFNMGMPLLPVQLLWINLITDSFPAFALGMEEKEEGIMDQPPRNPQEPIVDKKMGISIAFQSIGLAIAALISFQLGLSRHGNIAEARTFCFITLILGELIRAYSAKSEDLSIFKIHLWNNKFLNYAIGIAVLLLFVVVYWTPAQVVFSTISLPAIEFLYALGLAIIPLFFGEISKKFKR